MHTRITASGPARAGRRRGGRGRKGSAGFTLIEVVVVIVIIGILATIAIPRLMDAREQAFRASAMSDLRNLLSYQELWRSDQGTYAGSTSELEIEFSEGVDLEITAAHAGGWAAQAEQSFMPAMTCGIFYGSADPADGAPATTPGVVHCSR